MSKPSGPGPTSTLSFKHWMILAMAGLGSFLVPFWLQGGGTPEDDLVAAMPRDQHLKARAAPVSMEAGGAAEAMPSNDTTPSFNARMNRVVVRDPFGLLMPETVAIAPPPPPAPPVQRRQVAKVVAVAGPPAPPPAAVAPPLPFTAIGFIQGQRIGDGQQQTFIQQGEKLTVIRQGDTINNTYRVDAITAERIVVTYLPLGQKQTLPLLDNLK